MYPILGTLPFFGFELRSYQMMRWTYLLVALGLTAYLNRRQGIRPQQTLGAFLVGIPAALIGGHLLNVFEAWPFYRAQPSRVLDVFTGGNSIYGALVFGTGSGVAYLRWRGLALRSFLDAAAPAMALGEAMTRIGCFLNGCCFGVPTDTIIGVTFPYGSQPFIAHASAGLIALTSPRSLPVHPTQLYSAGISALLFFGLLWLFLMGRRFPGMLFCVFLIGYGLQRLLVGIWRADTALYWWDVSQPLSLAMVAAGILLWGIWRRQWADGETFSTSHTVRTSIQRQVADR
jgi:phosphatidylglycerol---prolipoprotein diacylglyceryl transferase